MRPIYVSLRDGNSDQGDQNVKKKYAHQVFIRQQEISSKFFILYVEFYGVSWNIGNQNLRKYLFHPNNWSIASTVLSHSRNSICRILTFILKLKCIYNTPFKLKPKIDVSQKRSTLCFAKLLRFEHMDLKMTKTMQNKVLILYVLTNRSFFIMIH